MDRKELFSRAIPFFTVKGYQPQTQTDYFITFLSESREVNWILLIVLLCCGIIPGIIYYYVFCHKHQVTISISGDTEVHITAIGNTETAEKNADEFTSTIRGIVPTTNQVQSVPTSQVPSVPTTSPVQSVPSISPDQIAETSVEFIKAQILAKKTELDGKTARDPLVVAGIGVFLFLIAILYPILGVIDGTSSGAAVFYVAVAGILIFILPTFGIAYWWNHQIDLSVIRLRREIANLQAELETKSK